MALRSKSYSIIVNEEVWLRLCALRQDPELEPEVNRSWSSLLNSILDELNIPKYDPPQSNDQMKGGDSP